MKLVTVDAYNIPIQAEVARNALEMAGIRAVVQGADFVGNYAYLSNAVGGVKLQVADHDVKRALELISEMKGAVDEVELERQALEAEPVEDEAPPTREAQALNIQADVIRDPPPLHERDAYAHRFFRAAVFNFLIPLLTPYALYLLLNAAFGSGPVSRAGVWRIITGSMMLVFQPLFWFLLYGFSIAMRS